MFTINEPDIRFAIKPRCKNCDGALMYARGGSWGRVEHVTPGGLTGECYDIKPDYDEAPDGLPFSRGEIEQVHRLGDHIIVEYRDYMDRLSMRFVLYHCEGDVVRRAGRTYRTLERAIIGAIAVKYDGVNTRADGLIARMLGLPEA